MGLPNSYALLMPVSVPLPIVSIKIGYNIYKQSVCLWQAFALTVRFADRKRSEAECFFQVR